MPADQKKPATGPQKDMPKGQPNKGSMGQTPKPTGKPAPKKP